MNSIGSSVSGGVRPALAGAAPRATAQKHRKEQSPAEATSGRRSGDASSSRDISPDLPLLPAALEVEDCCEIA